MTHMSNAATVVNKLMEKGWHVSLAESCTGGMVAAELVSIPDASKVLDRSFVTYSEQAKTELVSVPEQLICTFGVVSEQVAGAMASGAARAAGCEVGVGITGVAGPTGGTDAVPVGTVCFGFYLDGAVQTWTCHFAPAAERNAIRRMATEFVLDALSELL